MVALYKKSAILQEKLDDRSGWKLKILKLRLVEVLWVFIKNPQKVDCLSRFVGSDWKSKSYFSNSDRST